MERIEIKAFAKINLGLRVVSKRKDGYHDLITAFQRISLSDSITLEKNGRSIEYIGPIVTDNPEDNLCFRAVKAFAERFGIKNGVTVQLEKKIPSGAGLGGGSSNAAVVLE